MRAQFIQIPVELLTDPQVSALELRIYGILLRYGLEGSGKSMAGHRLLAKNCNCHTRTIAKSLKNLQSLGWITIRRRGLNLNDEIRCLKTIKKPKPNKLKAAHQETASCSGPSIIDKRKKRYRRDKGRLTDIQRTPPGKPQGGASTLSHVENNISHVENREVQPKYREAQQTLTTVLADNIRPAGLYWFKNAIVTGNTTDQLAISVGNDQVQLVQEQYSGLLGRLMDKKVIVNR